MPDVDSLCELVIEAFQLAIVEFYEKDGALFDYPKDGGNSFIGERSMVFRIGHYMANTIEPILLRHGLNIDCEYNRHLHDVKELDGSRIIPDLLVHQRLVDQNNLMIFEFKKGYSTGGFREKNYDKKSDLKKLRGLTHPEKSYHYRYGLYVELNEAKVHTEVFRNSRLHCNADYLIHDKIWSGAKGKKQVKAGDLSAFFIMDD